MLATSPLITMMTMMIKFVANGEQMGGNGKSNDNGVNLPDVRYVSSFRMMMILVTMVLKF